MLTYLSFTSCPNSPRPFYGFRAGNTGRPSKRWFPIKEYRAGLMEVWDIPVHFYIIIQDHENPQCILRLVIQKHNVSGKLFVSSLF